MSQHEEVRIHRALSGDEREVARFHAAFDYPVLDDQTRRFLADDRHHLLLGYVDDRPAGFLSAVEIFQPDKRGELFLNEISVIEDARRHGVARALIAELNAVGRELGCEAIWVLTDDDNEPAMNLYRGTGGRWDGKPHVMFEYQLDEG